ncbi:hypothetical protein OAR52_00305, partial [bacterium]|nr:hypothetical protein [bacterium]
KTGNNKTGNTKTGNTKTGNTKTGNTKTGNTKTGRIKRQHQISQANRLLIVSWAGAVQNWGARLTRKSRGKAAPPKPRQCFKTIWAFLRC